MVGTKNYHLEGSCGGRCYGCIEKETYRKSLTTKTDKDKILTMKVLFDFAVNIQTIENGFIVSMNSEIAEKNTQTFYPTLVEAIEKVNKLLKDAVPKN